MIVEVKDPKMRDHEKYKDQRLKLVKKYYKKHDIPFTVISDMVVIDLAKMSKEQYRHIKRILSGKYDDEISLIQEENTHLNNRHN